MDVPRRGEVWRADLDPTRGDEIGKTRPVVVMNKDSYGRLALRVVVPLTSWNHRFAGFPWMTRIDPQTTNGLTKPSAADAFQICSLSETRFVDKIGMLSTEEMDTIAASVALMIGFRP